MAKFNIVLHGVPYGHNCTASEIIDPQYFQRFYVSDKSGEKLYFDENAAPGISIYTFCLYPDKSTGQVFGDQNGRPGSFVGLSLVIDSGFKFDRKWILNELRKCYYQYVHNKLVKNINNNYKWVENVTALIDNQAQISQLTSKMEKYIISRYNEDFQQNNQQSKQTDNKNNAAKINIATEKLKAEIADLEAQLNVKRQQLAKLQQNIQK